MAAEITEITPRNLDDTQGYSCPYCGHGLFTLAIGFSEGVYAVCHGCHKGTHPGTQDLIARLGRLERNLAALLGAWAAGGLRGLRQAAGRLTDDC